MTAAMPSEWMLLALGETDPISGGAGWVGAGLLGLVLGWLMLKHLPEKDSFIKALIDASNARYDLLLTKCDASLESQRKSFREALDLVVAHCKEEMELTRSSVAREVADLLKEFK
jgi:hypothetical protein